MNNLAMTVKETGSIFTVDARALHEWLGVRKDFSDWFKSQVERVDMVERIHYEVVFPLKGENSRGRPAKDFMITISAAKHIGMMSNTARGKEVRRYFEACEEKLKEVSKPKEIQQPKSSLDILMAQYEMFGLMLQNQIDLRNQVQRNTEQNAIADSRISALEARADTDDNYVTIAGYLSLKKIKGKTGEEIRVLGMHVAKYCKENGIKIAKVSSAKHGEVNAYPKEVLEMLIGDAA